MNGVLCRKCKRNCEHAGRIKMIDEMYSRKWWKERLPIIVPFTEGANILCGGKPPNNPHFNADFSDYTITPKTITVNGFEVPAPETAEPKNGTEYFIPSVYDNQLVTCCHWDYHHWDNLRLARGTVYLNKDHAIARAKAMIGIDPAEDCKMSKFPWGKVLDNWDVSFDGEQAGVIKFHPYEYKNGSSTGRINIKEILYHCHELHESFYSVQHLLIAWIAYKNLGLNNGSLVSGITRALEIKGVSK